jgi:hypothetical protein
MSGLPGGGELEVNWARERFVGATPIPNLAQCINGMALHMRAISMQRLDTLDAMAIATFKSWVRDFAVLDKNQK